MTTAVIRVADAARFDGLLLADPGAGQPARGQNRHRRRSRRPGQVPTQRCLLHPRPYPRKKLRR